MRVPSRSKIIPSSAIVSIVGRAGQPDERWKSGVGHNRYTRCLLGCDRLLWGQSVRRHLMSESGEFVASMAAFLLWSFRSKGLTKGPNGETLDQLSVKMLTALIEPVRGNRGPDAPFGPADLVAII